MSSDDQPKCPIDHSIKDVWVKHVEKSGNSSYSSEHPVLSIANDETDKRKGTVNGIKENFCLKKLPSQMREEVECSSDSIIKPLEYKTDVPLPTEREISSIPRTGNNANWVYPSQKQFYEAMLRKNWSPMSEDMKTVVSIHNSVNERVWNYIKRWEEGSGGDLCGGIKLKSFKGDSKRLSPRAWLRSTLLGYSKPFDRHDWKIDRCGKQIEYVIDFYADELPNSGSRIFLDVRPKLNSYEGVKLRVLKALGL